MGYRAFHQGRQFCDFLFALLRVNPRLKRGLLYSQLEHFFFLLEQISFRMVDKTISTKLNV